MQEVQYAVHTESDHVQTQRLHWRS